MIEESIAVFGLGYVGLPLAIAIAATNQTCAGIDANPSRIAELRNGHDHHLQVPADELRGSTICFSHDPEAARGMSTYIVAVPTPVDDLCRPDLGHLVQASRSIGPLMDPSKRPIVVFESTVYPGVTQDICGPELERASGLKRGRDFFLGYSPERINPGDVAHSLKNQRKIVAFETPETADRLRNIYAKISGGVVMTSNIRAAEAAKALENAQRDVNIALVNEMTQLLALDGISMFDVLELAETKWNFMRHEPGLVGGHCIGVDPYYLAHYGRLAGVPTQLILTARAVNNDMRYWIGRQVRSHVKPRGDILVLGATYKQDVPDVRNSQVPYLLKELDDAGYRVSLHDPLIDEADLDVFSRSLLAPDALAALYDGILLLVPHAQCAEQGFAAMLQRLRPDGMLLDLKGLWRKEQRPTRIKYVIP